MKQFIITLMLLTGIIGTQSVMAHPSNRRACKHMSHRHHHANHKRHARVVEVRPVVHHTPVVVHRVETRPVARPVVVVEHPQPAPRPVVVVEHRPNTAAVAGAVVGGIIGGVIGSLAR